jgi:hypothetical protein
MDWGNPSEAYGASATAVADSPPGGLISPLAMRQRRADVTFEYQGATAMTVVSPLTRRTYCFPHPGARLTVDPRDTTWLTFTRNLARAL